jgi:UDP-N-acetylglucosamine--N-acetylmuramyl-(pentapeptide) pyrophosphoryl-undecaprenol N-acetylglucosamine transferase
MSYKLLVMAGGTGGHVFPGLAVADHLTKHGWQVQWLGTANRMEAQLVPKHGYKIDFIDVAGVRGNGIIRLLKAPFQIIKSFFQARKVIKQFSPNVVLGMGGFASGPGGIAAWSSGIPLVLHEQNAVPGLTNKILAKFAQQVLTGFNQTFPAQLKATESKYLWVGNPVREAFNVIAAKLQTDSPIRILVVGGSLGAQVLNQEVPKALVNLANYEVRHQCGAGHMIQVEQAYKEQIGDKAQWYVEEFITDVSAAFCWADIVICRAGALTVAEISAAGRASIFVPLPHAVDDHQTKNARALADIGAALLCPQQNLLKGELVELLQSLFASPNRLVKMGNLARTLAKHDATEKVAAYCNQFAEQRL